MIAPPPQTVIVLVDDDSSLLELLAGMIRAPGRLVDTLSGAEGLTPELIALSQPRLVLINPRTGQLGSQQMFELIRSVRQITGARFVLMLNAEDVDKPGLTQRYGADEALPIESLLRAPIEELVPDKGGDIALVEPAPNAPSAFSMMDAEAILAMDLTADFGPTPPKTAAAPVAAPKQNDAKRKQVAQDLSKFIDEELAKVDDAPKRVHHFEIDLNTMSEHNVFTHKGKPAGIFAGTVYPPAIGSPATVKLSFPWGESFNINGVAAWVRSDVPFGKRKRGGIGITLEIDEKLAKAMARFVGLRAPLTAP